MTYREIIYMINDLLKLNSDDSYFTEDHILFLISKYRIFLLKQKYSDIKKPISEINYSTICLDLEEVSAISNQPCEGGTYLRSVQKVPFMLSSRLPRVYPIDYYQGEITYVSRDRMKYIGYNKYLQNIIYCSLGPDNYLYFKSNNPQHKYLEKVKINALFSDLEAIHNLQCDDQGVICDIYDTNFPLEGALVQPLIELVVNTLRNPEFSPKDSINNANDDLSNVSMKANADRKDKQ